MSKCNFHYNSQTIVKEAFKMKAKTNQINCEIPNRTLWIKHRQKFNRHYKPKWDKTNQYVHKKQMKHLKQNRGKSYQIVYC